MNFTDFWAHADVLARTLTVILVVMSVTTWTVFLLRVWATRRAQVTAMQQLEASVAEVARLGQDLTLECRRDVAEQALLQQLARTRNTVERGITILGTIAAISPFIGLFGTVWGIFHALVSIGQSGQAGLAQVAGPVGEALIMTGIGLAVAIPAVLTYNICVRLNRVLANHLHDRAHSLLVEQLLPKPKTTPTLGGSL